jgi:hypothetical protein
MGLGYILGDFFQKTHLVTLPLSKSVRMAAVKLWIAKCICGL